MREMGSVGGGQEGSAGRGWRGGVGRDGLGMAGSMGGGLGGGGGEVRGGRSGPAGKVVVGRGKGGWGETDGQRRDKADWVAAAAAVIGRGGMLGRKNRGKK